MALGFTQNKSDPVIAILEKLAGNNEIKDLVSGDGVIYRYYNNGDDPNNNFSFITPVHLKGTGAYAKILELAQLCYHENNQFTKIVVPMISGNGKHIFTAFICFEGNPNTVNPLDDDALPTDCKIRVKFFDSKVSNTNQLFRVSRSSTASIYTLLRAVKPSVKDKPIKLNPRNKQSVIETEYNGLGTQSYFDDKTCSLQTPPIVEQLSIKMPDITSMEEFKNNINVGCFDHLLSVEHSLNQLRQLEKPEFSIPKTKASDFLIQAWRDVFLPLNSSDIHNEKFKHYFLGFPKEGIINKLVYFATFGFVLRPVASLIKFVIEFPLSLAHQAAHYLQTKLMTQGPRNPFLQYLRSALLVGADVLMGLTKVFHVMARLITSPINSVKLASEVKPRLLGKTLAVTSMFISISLYIGFIAFFAPIILPMAGAVVPASTINTATGVLSAIGTPWLMLAKVAGGAAMAPVTGALGTIVCALGIRKVFEALVKKATRKDISYNLGTENRIKRVSFPSDDWEDDEDFNQVGSKPVDKRPISSKEQSYESGDENSIHSDTSSTLTL